MMSSQLISLQEAAATLDVSEAMIGKFIKKGLIPITGTAPGLTPYNLRRLRELVRLYESGCTPEDLSRFLNS